MSWSQKLRIASALLLGGCMSLASAAGAHPRVWTVDDLYASPGTYAQGHRGFGADEFDPNPPGENTLAGFQQAFRNGVRVIELDLQRTADDKIVVIHDDYFPDYTCIRSLTYEQLLARRPDVPLFRTVLNVARRYGRGDCMSGLVFAEIKVPVPLCDTSNTSPTAAETESELVAAVVTEIRRARMEDQVILNSGSPSILAHVRQQAPEIRRALTLNALQLLSPAEACAVLPPGLCPVHIPKSDCGLEWYDIGPIARLPAFPGNNAAQRYAAFLGTALSCSGASEVALDKGVLLPAGPGGAAQLVAAAHGAGLEVDVWTVDTANEWSFVAAAGVDAITTNNIPLALASQSAAACRWPGNGRHGRDDADEDVAEADMVEGLPATAADNTRGFTLVERRAAGAVEPVQLAFTLPDAGPAEIGVFDVAGRKLESRDVGSLGAGAHRIGMGRNLAPGMYLVRLIGATGQAHTKVIVTR